LPFKGLGKTKLLTMIERGITSAKELLLYDGTDPLILPHWKTIVENYYDGLETEMAALTGTLTQLSEQLDWIKEEIDIQEDELAENTTVDGTVKPPPIQRRIPAFLPLLDCDRYNVRVITKSTIDRIVVTDFQHRKAVQENKMRGIKSSVLKIDWHYKLPPKIKVYTGRGKSFSPFKSAVSIQDEDAQTIFWKCYPCSEGMETLKPDLFRLKQRLEIVQGQLPKMAYVDNCCQVRQKLLEVFGPEFIVALDCFHWVKRWDNVLYDTKSAQAAIFRGLIHRALFIVEPSEFQRAKFVLEGRLRRDLTDKEVMKEAKAMIPEAKTLVKRVEAVVQYVCFQDLTTDMPTSNTNFQRRLNHKNPTMRHNRKRPKTIWPTSLPALISMKRT
jgi:hypothetical protein